MQLHETRNLSALERIHTKNILTRIQRQLITLSEAGLSTQKNLSNVETFTSIVCEHLKPIHINHVINHVVDRTLVWHKHRWYILQTNSDTTTTYETTRCDEWDDENQEWKLSKLRAIHFRSRRIAKAFLKQTTHTVQMNIQIRPVVPVEYVTVDFKTVKNISIDNDMK